MLLTPFGALQAQHEPAQRLLRFQWLNPYETKLRPALEYGRDLVLSLKPNLVLVDFTCLPPLSLADEMWMSVYWLPPIASLPLQRVGLVSRPEHLHNQMATEALIWVARHLMRFQFQIFDEPDAALDWLTDGNLPVVNQLLTEWDTQVVAGSQHACY